MARRSWLAAGVVVSGLMSAILVNWATEATFTSVQPYQWWIIGLLAAVTVVSVWLMYHQLDEDGHPRVRVRARRGGRIERSPVTAPADSDPHVEIEATGKGSAVKDSPVKLS